MVTNIALDTSGKLSIAPNSIGLPLGFSFELNSQLDEPVKAEISFSTKSKATTALKDILCHFIIRDMAYGDVIVEIQGHLHNDEEDITSLVSAAHYSNEFKVFEQTEGVDALNSIQSSDGYNPVNGLGRNKAVIEYVAESDASFDADQLYTILTNLDEKPSYLVLPQVSDLEVYTVALRAALKLNIPLDIELDPTLTVAQVSALGMSLDAQSQLVQLIWSPNICRARDSILARGKKMPCYAIGQYLGYKMLRNENTTAQGIPKIADPIAGEPYPFTFKAMEARGDIVLDDDALEELATAKINVVRRINYDTGTKFVLSDILTQYKSDTSALRLVNAAEITSYTTNRVIEILRRHMLKRMESYLSDASRDIEKFLNACANKTAGLLQKAEDLGGVPYTFTLTPDEKMPFERVRLYLARRPEGAVRSVIFDDVITK